MNWRKKTMELNSENNNLDGRKIDNIKYQILDMEAENIVKRESNAAMVDKIRKMIIREVEKR